MAELKTKPQKIDVKTLINKIDSAETKQDCLKLIELMSKITGEQAVLWGTSMIGFGSYHYKYESGREGDYFQVGFSPRKTNITIYVMCGFSDKSKLMEKLGKYKTSGGSCLYVKKLADIDLNILEKLIKESLIQLEKKYPSK